MLFTKTFSTVLLSTLFVTSAFGGFTQVKRSEDETSLLARGLAAIDLGPDPGFKQYKKYFQTYCRKPFPKKGGKRDEIEQRGLDGRAMPAGYQNIPMGRQKGSKASQPGMYSGEFGSCVGLIVTGTPREANGVSRFLAHLAMGPSWQHMKGDWDDFVKVVQVAQLTNMKGWVYTLDTSLSKDPSYQNDPYMKAEAEGLEEVYRTVRSGLETLVGSAQNVVRETHSFQHVGEMSVSPNGAVSFSTA